MSAVVADKVIDDLLPGLGKLRALGVTRFKLDDLEVEFSTPDRVASGAIVPPGFTQNAPHQEDLCACGHMAGPAHDPQGLCLLGCEAVKCAAGPK